jgi:hypothetical protein
MTGVLMSKKKRPAIRSNTLSTNEYTTLNLRTVGYYELALPVISAEGDDEDTPYPPANGKVKLTSEKGYEQVFDVKEGVQTGDGYCSFRFEDLETYKDDQFTAVLEWNDEKEVLFEKQKIATFVDAAKNQGDYEVPFPASKPASTASPLTDDDTTPEDDSDGMDESDMEKDFMEKDNIPEHIREWLDKAEKELLENLKT